MAVCPPCCKLNLVLSRACAAAFQIDDNFDPVDFWGTKTVKQLGYLSPAACTWTSQKTFDSSAVLIELVYLIYTCIIRANVADFCKTHLMV